MAETPVPSFSTVLEYLHLTLRYVASGFVAIGVYMFLYHTKIDVTEKSWFLIFLTAAIGIVTYALHFATIDKIFYGNSIIWFLKRNNNYIPEVLKNNIKDWQDIKNKKKITENFLKVAIKEKMKKEIGDAKKAKEEKKNYFERIDHNNAIKRYLLFAFANQTYLRLISGKRQLMEIQNLVEKRLALLNFLYCSFYQVAIISVYFLFSKCSINIIDMQKNSIPVLHNWSNIFKNSLDLRLIITFVFAIIIRYSAVKFQRRICAREMWIVTNFPQDVKKMRDKIEQEKVEPTYLAVAVKDLG